MAFRYLTLPDQVFHVLLHGQIEYLGPDLLTISGSSNQQPLPDCDAWLYNLAVLVWCLHMRCVVCIWAKRLIRLEIVPVSVGSSDYKNFYSLLDGILVNHKVMFSIKFTITHWYNLMERGTVSGPRTQHNIPGQGTRPEVSALTIKVRQLFLCKGANQYLAIIEWGSVGYEEFCKSRRVLSTEAEGRGGKHPPRSAEFFIS